MLTIALSVASCAAYFSVWGLSQLFAGASTAVIIMASILEIGKLITTTALHRYWDKLTKALKLYLTTSVVVLMMITSAGIYGFLSNAYQKTANKLEIHDGEVGVLDAKKGIFEKNILSNEKIIESKNKRLDQLSGLRGQQESRIDLATSNGGKSSVRGDISNADKEIARLSSEIDVLNTKNSVLSDSVGVYNVKVLNLKSKSEVSGEVGPLKYIAELTGVPMAKVVNYLILLLIFVFDPLAIALILMTNKVFELEGTENPLEPNKIVVGEIIEEEIEEEIEIDNDIIEPIQLDEQFDDNDAVTDVVSDVDNDAVISTPEPEPVVKPRVRVDEIREGNRGYSVKIPNYRNNQSSNTIDRIGSNKIVKDGDNNKVIFKRE